jgi:hypothetical protein
MEASVNEVVFGRYELLGLLARDGLMSAQHAGCAWN